MVSQTKNNIAKFFCRKFSLAHVLSASHRRFSKFDACSTILFQINVLGAMIKETTLAKHLRKITTLVLRN